MFKKILIANRGEIAVRLVRTCREMGIKTVALYHVSDRTSLHVRLADECIELTSPMDFVNDVEIMRIARGAKVEAIHPGYGFLAEEPEFARMCESEGIIFIGPSADVIEKASQKIEALKYVKQAGFPTVDHSEKCFEDYSDPMVSNSEKRLGYPLLVKSCRGGRGRGARLVYRPDKLREAFFNSQAESKSYYHEQRIYIERAIQPAHQIGVQVLGDKTGNVIHLGEREGSLIYGNQKMVEETPAPCLSAYQREELLDDALKIARLFNIDNLATIEFILDMKGNRYFTEIKPRLQIDHSLTEMVTRIDLVKAQLMASADRKTDVTQEKIQSQGYAIQCRITAEDPWVGLLPYPGRLKRVNFPGGPDVRVDTYISSGCEIPVEYDPLIAKLIVWGESRQACLSRVQMALEEFRLSGTPSNLSILQRLVNHPIFVDGKYDTSYRIRPYAQENGKIEPYYAIHVDQDDHDTHIRDLAIAAAIHYFRRSQLSNPTTPERFTTGWHRSSRRFGY